VTLRGNVSIAVPKGVTVEVEDLSGNLDVADLAAPFRRHSRSRHLHAHRIGAISMRDTVSGNVSIKQAGAVDGLKIRGALSVESAGAITFSHVAGSFDCRAIDGEVAIEKIAGSANLLGVHAPFIARVIGGHLESKMRRTSKPAWSAAGARLESVRRPANRQSRRQARG